MSAQDKITAGAGAKLAFIPAGEFLMVAVDANDAEKANPEEYCNWPVID